MTWVHFAGGRDKIYRMRWGADHYEVHRDATVYRLTNPTETRRYRPDQAGRVQHWTRVRMLAKEKRLVLEEVRKRTGGAWPRRWYHRLTARWRREE